MTSRAAFVAVMLGASSFLMGCQGALTDSNANGDGADAGTGEDANPADLARAFYDENVAAGLNTQCNSCHGAAAIGTPFLNGADTRETILATPNMVIPGDGEGSRLYSYGRMTHSGPALSTDLAEQVRLWIDMEPSADEAPPLVETKKFTPAAGANTVDLSELGEGLEGASLTFDAAMITAGVY